MLRRNVLWNTAGSLFYHFAQWLITWVVVRLAGYEQAGYLSLAISATNIFLFGIRSYQVSDYEEKYSATTYVYTRLLTCIICYLLCIIVVLTGGYSSWQMMIILAYMLFRSTESFVDVFHGIDQKKWRMDIVGKSFFLRGISQLLFFVVSFYITRNLLFSILCMFAISALIVIVYDAKKARELESFCYIGELAPSLSLLKGTVPLAVQHVSTTAVTSIPRMLLDKLMGNVSLGIYSTIAMPTVVVQACFTFIMSPYITLLSECLEAQDKHKFLGILVKGTLLMVAFSGFAVIVIVFAGEFGLNLIFGSDILPYKYLLLPAFFVTVLTALSWFYNGALVVLREIKSVVFTGLIGAIISIGISTFCITSYGMNGVNITLFFAYGVQIICMIFCLGKAISNKFPKSR